MENIFYVYLHRRKTDNKVFYVGKGKGKRAYSKQGRSDWWRRTADKHGFVVEIVFEHLPEKEAFQCEKDTILEFRYFNHPLVNLTDGGDGMSGHKPSAETILKRTQQTTGKKRTDEQKLRMSLAQLKRHENLPKIIKEKPPRKPIVCKFHLETVKRKIKETKSLTGSGKGLKHPSADLNIYTFKEVSSGELFTGTRFDFATYVGLKSSNFSGFFRKEKPRKTIANWQLVKDNNDTKTEEKTEEH